jgi:cobalt-zinc-cadmium efflux system outer membrane protein
MHWPKRAAAFALYAAAVSGLCTAQEWTEASIVAEFLNQSPQAREARARVAVAEAEARGRTRHSNPRVNYSRESAGLTEFFQAEHTLPVSGRIKLLRQSGASSVRATVAEGAFDLWQARIALRQSFFLLLATQERETIYAAAIAEIERVIGVLRQREIEGEGSRFDRLRTERERAELLAELTLVRAEIEIERGRLLAYLRPDIQIGKVSGQLESAVAAPDIADLTRHAMNVREDVKAEQGRLEQFRLEQRAAEKLRIPEPVLNAGLKRADVGGNRIGFGPVVGISIPLLVFNKGQDEVARFTAEQERISARLQILTRQIRSAIEGSARAYAIRAQARDNFRRELADSGPDLIRIATVAYQEGEIGILQLLDAYRSQRQAQLRMIEIQSAVKEGQIELERVVGEELGK